MPAQSVTIALEQFTTFGDLLKYLRRRSGLTQRELSIAVGYSVPQISRLEQNQRLPDLAMVTARFLPALQAEDEPAVAARLLALAAAMRREDAPAPGLPPYKGLLYFDEGDAELFFGREALTEKLVERVTLPTAEGQPRFLAVVGASGSGKSSLVRAGLIPALRWQPATAAWGVAVLTPTGHPLEALAAALASEGKTGAASMKLADELAGDGRALQRQVGRMVGGADGARGTGGDTARGPNATSAAARFLLVVDQFEELFTLCRSEAEQAAFVDNLLTAASEPGGAAMVVIALRADFYAQCARFDRLRVALAHQQEYIGPMTAAELRRAIEEPARRGRWEFEAGLVDTLLKDVGADGTHPPEPGALPLLSHALMETWQRRRGQTLTFSGYMAAGGVRGAIAETAEAVFHDQLDPAQRSIARQIFLRLTELGEEGVTADTRRRAAFSELIPSTAGAPAVREVLQALADARLITTDQEAAEVAHEALIREWPTLRGWLEEDRQGLWLHRQLTEAAQGWVKLDKDADALYRGARLAQALEWAGEAGHGEELNALEQEFLAASKEATEREAVAREAARQRELAAARQLAETETARAESEKAHAEAARKLGETEKQRAEDQSRAARQLRRRAVYLLGAFMLAIALAAAALYFGERARQTAVAAQAAGQLATARELAADAVNNLEVDPERSVLLALQGVARADLPETESALHQAVMADRLQRTLADYPGDVWQVAYSPDGQRLATTQAQGAVVWDAASGKPLLTFKDQTISFNGVAFSPDGGRIVTTSDDHTAKVWEAATGRVLLTLNYDGQVLRPAFSPDGTRLAATSFDQTTRIWDAQTGRLIFNLPGTGMMFGIAYSPDGKRLGVTEYYGPDQIWDTISGKLLLTLEQDLTLVDNRAIAFSPDSQRVATAATNHVKVWDLTTGQELLTLTADEFNIRGLEYSPDGRYLVAAGMDRKATVWDAATGQRLFALAGHAAPIDGIAFSPDGQHLATGSWDTTTKIWDMTPAHELLTIADADLVRGNSPVLALSPDGGRVAVSGVDSPVQLFDTTNGSRLLTLPGTEAGSAGLVFSPDGAHILRAGFEPTETVSDATSGKTLLGIDQLFGAGSGAFSPDGKRLVGESDDTISVRDSATGQVIWSDTESGKAFASVAFSPDGMRVAGTYKWSGANGSNSTGFVTVWDAATGKRLVEFVGGTEPFAGIRFSPDGKRLAALSSPAAKIWDAGTGKELLKLDQQAGGLTSIVFSPDGTRLAIGSGDGASIWDSTTGQALVTLPSDGSAVNDLAFSPDGTRLYAVSSKALYVFALKLGDLIALAKARVTRALTAAECQQFLNVSPCPVGP